MEKMAGGEDDIADSKVIYDMVLCMENKDTPKFSSNIIRMSSVAMSYMRKGLLIYEEMCKYLTIYEDSSSHFLLCN
jgi:hypothetical protein